MCKVQVDLSNMLLDFIDAEVRKAKEYLDFYEKHKGSGVDYDLFLELAKQEFRHAELLFGFGSERTMFDNSVVIGLRDRLYGLRGLVGEV